MRVPLRPAALALLAASNTAGAASDLPLERIRPFFDRHCYECHDEDAKKGGLDLTKIATDLSDAAGMDLWVRIHDRVRDGEMPPGEKPRPETKEIDAFTKALEVPLATAHRKEKGTVLRRLNRREYQNTLNDMLGIDLRLAELLPEDGRSHEFDTVGASLNISMVQLQRYLEAADLASDAAIAKSVSKPPAAKNTASYKGSREGDEHIGKVWKELPDGAVVRFSGGGYPTGMLRGSNVRKPGRYRVKVTGYAYQSEDPITFSVGGTSFARGSEKPVYGYFAFEPGSAQSIEFVTKIERNYMIQIEPYGIRDRDRYQRESIEGYGGPGLAILSVELEGPLVEQFPSRGHRLLFEGIDRHEVEPRNPNEKKKSWYKPKFAITSDEPAHDAAAVLRRFAERAFRRPVSIDEVAPYRRLFVEEFAGGGSFEDSLRTAAAAVLCAPDFLYLQEAKGALDDYALAARLSYFLTRSLPDAQLLQAAADGLADDRDALRSQTERLLAHPHSARFVEDFTDAWLDLRSIEFTNPDQKLFPEFDSYLQWSMVEETRAFFRELIDANLGATNIVKSEFAMLNERLASHYGIGSVAGPQLRRVALPNEHPRGGFLAQGSVLKVSANGTNTSPVVRGVWVLERILGFTPPPPPPGISGVEPDIRGASTLRELLDKHRSMTSCNSCHRKIDPPGFALESFNPIGGERERFRSLGEGEKIDLQIDGRRVQYRLGQPVDAAGVLPNGREFDTFVEFRDLLAEDSEAIARSFVEKLLTFAAGRETGFSDRQEIDAIVAKSARTGHRTRDLIHLVIASEIFRSK